MECVFIQKHVDRLKKQEDYFSHLSIDLKYALVSQELRKNPNFCKEKNNFPDFLKSPGFAQRDASYQNTMI